MKDRIPGSPGRVKITPEGGASYYAVLERADNPLEEGTPLNKANLLSDQTAYKIGLSDAEATPNIAFDRLAQIIYDSLGGVIINLTLQAADGTRIPNAQITGVVALSGGDAVTDANGQVTCVSLLENPTIGWGQDFADLEPGSQQITVASGETVSQTITVTTRNFAEYTESSMIKFSPLCTRLDISLLAGGGGGGGGNAEGPNYYDDCGGGGGGAGGEAITQESVTFTPAVEYALIVGAGGEGGASKTSGGAGGDTSLLGIVAHGGAGGEYGSYSRYGDTTGAGGTGNNGNGGLGASVGLNNAAGIATAGAQTIFTSMDTTATTGGGGGGGGSRERDEAEDYNQEYAPSAGAGNGGDGGDCSSSRFANHDGYDGTLGGGGGGGGAFTEPTTYPDGNSYVGKGGDGGNGKAALRMWHGEELAA